jgi:hypothetical protein
VLSLSIALWGVAMLWCATVGSFGMLLLAPPALGIVTGSAGPSWHLWSAITSRAATGAAPIASSALVSS